MKNKLLILIPLLSMLVACGGNKPAANGGEDPNKQEEPPVLEEYDAKIALPDTWQESSPLDKSADLSEALNSFKNILTGADKITIRDNIKIEMENIVFADLLGEEKEGVSYSAVLQEKASIKASGEVNLTIYKDVVQAEEGESSTSTYGIIANVSNFNLTFATEETYKDRPIKIEKVYIRIIALYDETLKTTVLYFDFGDLYKNIPNIATLVNLFAGKEVMSEGMVNTIKMSLASFSKTYATFSEITPYLEMLFKENPLQSLGITFEDLASGNLLSLIHSFLPFIFYLKASEIDSAIQKVIDFIGEQYTVRKSETETGVAGSFDRTTINQLGEHAQEIASILTEYLPPHSLEEIKEETGFDIATLGQEGVEIPDNIGIEFGYAYRAGTETGQSNMAPESLETKMRFAVAGGESIKIENKISITYNDQADTYRPSQAYLNQFTFDIIQQIQSWMKE